MWHDIKHGVSDAWKDTIGAIINKAKADERSGGSAEITGQHGGIPNIQPPPPPPPPAIPHYTQPFFFSNKQSQLQKATIDPRSTSHNYLQRFGTSSHF
jgi:hypothetical protein